MIIITPPIQEHAYRILEIKPTNEQKNNLLEYSKLVRDTYPNAKNGDIVITCPDTKRYRNDHTYQFIETNDDICVLPFMESDFDEYGHCNSLLKVNEHEPINMYCVMNAHNNLWWPSDELRNAIKKEERQKFPCNSSDNIEYVDIKSGDHIFRFMITDESDTDKGIFEYNKSCYDSPSGDYYINTDGDKGIVYCTIHKEPSVLEDSYNKFSVSYSNYDNNPYLNLNVKMYYDTAFKFSD